MFVCVCVYVCEFVTTRNSLGLQVLTREEARQILVARNEKNEQQARALYDFEGETKRELNFSKVGEAWQ